jgi:hypothetical protein
MPHMKLGRRLVDALLRAAVTRVAVTSVAVSGLALSGVAGCAGPAVDPPAASGSSPASTPTAGTAAAPSTAPPFAGDLVTLIAAPPPVRNVVSPPGAVDVQAMARLLAAEPAPLVRRLGELGFRQGAVAHWQLSQLNFLVVTLIQLGDESAARQWVDEQRQPWASRPQDSAASGALGVADDFDRGAQGGWLVGVPVANEEAGNVREVIAVFYRHDLVAHVSFTGTMDSHLPGIVTFADEQFARLP